MIKRIFAVIFLCLLTWSPPAHTDQLILNDGRVMEGKIVEKTDDYVTLDVGLATPVKYYQDEVREVSQSEGTLKEELESIGKGDGHDFLWKIDSDTAFVYLFGSIHLGKSDMYPLSQTIEDAFDSSTALVVEVDIDALPQLEVQQKTMAKGVYADDYIYNHISPKTLNQLTDALKYYGLPIESVVQFKPWLVAMILSVTQIKKLGYDEEFGVDLYFIRKARGEKEIIELESFEEQLDFLDGLPNQEMFLQYTLESLAGTEAMLNQFMKGWLNGDHKFLEKIFITNVLQEAPEVEPIYDMILFKRNKDMADSLEAMLASDQTYFVVVGAAHLVGEKGLVNILRDRGHLVQQQ